MSSNDMLCPKTNPIAKALGPWLLLLAGVALRAQDCPLDPAKPGCDPHPERIAALNPVGSVLLERPWLAALADLDGDADLDLVSVNTELDNLSVYFQQSPGTFEAAPQGPIGDSITTPSPVSVAMGDLDLDGLPDLVSANLKDGNLTIFYQDLGESGRRFVLDPGGPLPISSSGLGAGAVIAADLDGDQDLDLAAENPVSSTVWIFANEGGRAFAPPVELGTGAGPTDLVAADLDRDGSLDLLTANNLDDTLTVLLNGGNGGFTPTLSLPVGSLPVDVAILDLDGDGFFDLAAANSQSSDVSVLLNRGRPGGGDWKGFEARQDYPVAAGPTSVAAADLDGDSTPDLAVASQDRGLLQVLPGTREDDSPRLKAPLSFELGAMGLPGARRFVAAGPEGTDPPVLAVVNTPPGEVAVFRYVPPPPGLSASGDVNGNRLPDDCEPDCNGNQLPDCYDIEHGISRDDSPHDGLPDECGPAPVVFHRADPDSSGSTELTDAIVILNFLFLGGRVPSCMDSADANDDGRVDLSDAVFILAFLFLGGGAIPAPGPARLGAPCGQDPAGTSLGCVFYAACGAL